MYQKRINSHFKAVFEVKYFIAHIMFYFINISLFIIAAYFSPTNIMERNPIRVFYALGGQYLLVTFRMQFSMVTLEKFNPFRRTVLVTWAILIVQIYLSVMYKTSIMDEADLYLIIAIYSFVSVSHLVYFLIDEIKTILNIKLFVIPYKQIKQAWNEQSTFMVIAKLNNPYFCD